MQKLCLDELENIRLLLDYHMEDDAAAMLHALQSCAAQSDCTYRDACACRLEALWSGHVNHAPPRPAQARRQRKMPRPA